MFNDKNVFRRRKFKVIFFLESIFRVSLKRYYLYIFCVFMFLLDINISSFILYILVFLFVFYGWNLYWYCDLFENLWNFEFEDWFLFFVFLLIKVKLFNFIF